MSGDRGANQRSRSASNAAALKARGIFHGVRMTRPSPNSGGLTMTFEAGSAAYRRRRTRRR